MSNLFSGIKRDQVLSRKQRDQVKANLLTTLIGEITKKAKDDGDREVTDLDVISTIKSFMSNMDIVLQHEEANVIALEEKWILGSYLPKQLDRDELALIISKNEFKNLGEFMKHLKANHAGLYDGAMAKSVFEQK